jgi:RNA-binding protein NOB1
MAAETPQKPIHSLILDTGPLIKNAVSISTIINSAEEIYTTSAIISEIRDEATRSRMQTSLMPFLKIKNPSVASYEAVAAFSKKTGDFAVLSRQDLGILALAYEVHCERNGGPWGLREAPKQPLKLRPGEKEEDDEVKVEANVDEGVKVDEADMHVEDAKVKDDVQTDQGVLDHDAVNSAEQPQTEEQSPTDDMEGWSQVPQRTKKNMKEDRPKKQKGSAKHKAMKAEKEQRKQARALQAESGEPAVAQESPEPVATGGVEVPATEESIQEQLQEESQEESQEPSQEQTQEQNQEQTQNEPQKQPEEQNAIPEEQATTEVSLAVDHEPTTQESAVEPLQDGGVPISSTAAQENQEQKAEADASAPEKLTQDPSTLNINTPPSPPATDDEESDDDWITPDNLEDRQAADAGLPTGSSTSPQEQLDVATMTIDFAMQNVLLQMNLRLLSTNMQRIRNLTSKVLRCHACFLTVKDMSRQFCPRCGGSTLKRVNCSTNSKGEFRLHLSKNYQFNKRGDKYSIPKPIAGTANTKWSGIGGGQGGWGRDLILTEDQKEYTKQIEQDRRAKGARDLMDDDYLPGILTGDRSGGRAGGRPKVGAGKNVNSKRMR